MFKNQYLIVNKDISIDIPNFKTFQFADYTIHAHNELNVVIKEKDETQIALIGYCIDPFNPREDDTTIVAKLSKQCSELTDFLSDIQKLSGRYVFLYKNSINEIFLGDACHLRQMYYGKITGGNVITSSPKLFLHTFNLSPQISDIKKNILSSPIFLEKESMWYGEESIDDRLKKLLPNHYYDLKKNKKIRIPFFDTPPKSEKEIMEYTKLILKNTYTALSGRFKIIQPLTAGLDSRILLGASKDVRNKITYYVFDMHNGKDQDVKTPTRLSKFLNIKFESIQPDTVSSKFLSIYKEEHIVARILPKTAHIQHHYLKNYNNTINVNGNCAEIARCTYGELQSKATLELILTLSKYQKVFPYFTEQIKKWYDEVENLTDLKGFNLLDLFYWEQRIGNWHATWQAEQDIAVEEISPFNNKALLLTMVKVDAKKRKSPNYRFYKNLAEELWPEVMKEKINPHSSYLKKLIKSNSILKAIAIQTKSTLKKLLKVNM